MVQPVSIHDLISEWTAKLPPVIASLTGQTPALSCTNEIASGDAGLGDTAQWYEFRLTTSAEAPPFSTLFVGASEASWLEIGNFALRAVGLDDPQRADAKNTYLEFLTQTTSGLSQALSSRLGIEITSSPAKAVERAPADLQGAYVDVSLTVPAANRLYVAFSPSVTGDTGSEERQPAEGVELAKKVLPAPEPPAPKSKTLDLLLEVELPVSVSFGRTQIPLKDVLKLTSGSILELNRNISEPVEVIVNNCVIARGEVVVVDGNYGIRIDQIVNRQERLRTLK